MKTKRKLIPKTNAVSSSAGSGQHNVVGQSGYDNVCNVDSGVPSKKQCVRRSTSVPCRLEVFGLPDVALSVPPNSHCTRQLNSASFRVQWSSTSVIPPVVDDELLLQSTRGDNVNTHSDVSGELCHRTDHVADANVFPNRSSGLQERNTCLRTRQESTIGRNSLRRQSRVSGPPSDYKHIGNCTYSCQHCGALFWYEERLKSSMPRGSRLRYNRTVREKLQDVHIPNFKVRLYNVIGTREYELPTRDMLGVIFYDPGPKTDMDYDIILEERSGPTGSSSEQKRVSMLAYYSYYLHDRTNRYNYLSRTGRLFQQYVVTAFCAIEHNRIDYIREHQNDIRNEYLFGIYNAINRGDIDGYDCGSRLILPQSFTVLYTVEFQKRGLPHCHTLLWIDESARVRKEEDIDVYISV
ncbi:DNA helicase [Tanacetum coccineum]|uniref:DNA helicase n=1 Tax=Tanacetum coccineum TaxID=301880 RepID=A0ABQ5FSH8_9ASTR